MQNGRFSPADAFRNHAAVLHQRRQWLTLITLCLAVLIVQLDTSVVNLATRPIGGYFHAQVGTLQWVVDSYNLVYAVLLLTGGLLADLYGRRFVYAIGAAVFTMGSLICASAPTIVVLISGRAVTGIGSALLIPASLAIIRVVWPEARERGRILGIWTACNGLAFAVGPTIGGVLIAHCGWRSIFLVVVPVGIAALGLALSVIPESFDPQGRHFDAAAQALGALALGGLAVAAIEAHGRLAVAVLGLGVALLALLLFIKVERSRGRAALVPLEVFLIPEFCGAVLATAGMTFGMYGVLFLLPLAWQTTGRLDGVGAGIALMPMALVLVLVSPFSGPLGSRLGAREMTSGGVGVIGLGLLVIGLTADSVSIVPAEIGLGLTGLGMGLAT
ncbi:MAG: MFS transporter, partial [Hyphomicrobiaceae bacterium]|nr:MFS transporter [Hyphomicrobiaceae bacterium]